MRPSLESTRKIFGRLIAAFLLPASIACKEAKLVEPLAPQPDRFAFVYLADSSGKLLGRLTEGAWPSWSPDGRHIVFERDGHVRVVDADGSNESDLGQGSWPTWSPDGSAIAFASAAGISVMAPDGTFTRALLSPALLALHDWGVGKPSWSPDGAFIAFDEPGAYDFGVAARIFAMSADGASQYTLAGYGQYESEPSWSPDGSKVVYWSSDHGLVIVARSGGLPMQVSADESAMIAARPAWSPDGQSILFNARARGRQSFQSTERPATAVMTISPEGGGARVLIDQGGDAAWSPDGTRIAFVRYAPR